MDDIMFSMRSQVIRTRNISERSKDYDYIVHVKPLLLLFIMLFAGLLITFLKPYLAIIGISLIILSLFCLIVMPDKDLCKFTKEYMVLFNRRHKDECTLVYYDEIVSWHYEWYKNYDQLVIELVDGSTEIQEMYSYLSIRKTMEIYAPGKMKKTNRRTK